MTINLKTKSSQMPAQANIHSLKLIILLLTTLFSHNLLAGHALPEFNARYAVQKYGIKLAEAHYQLAYTDKGYKFTQDTKLSALASMFASDTVSVISYVDEIGDNLLLTKHSYIQTGREKNRDEDINILWNTYKNTLKGKITGVVRSKEIELRTDTEIWDVLSFQIPLMIEANENIKEYPYRAILKGEIDNYTFILTSNKKTVFADKEYKIIQLVRTDPVKNRQLHIWLIPALNNIPVIVENYRDGKIHSRMQLESVSFNNKEPYTDLHSDGSMESNNDF
ncbi:MAG: DUF3108 domain-containing protein [Gammaproteobacteria bacterium]